MTKPGVSVEDVDFEALYQGGAAQNVVMPWDIGRPQPALVAIEESGGIGGQVLDIGCGLGDNALFLASRGHHVTGVDGAESAVRTARERAAAKGLDVEFIQADATRLDGLESRFDTVVDSALYHCLTENARHEYIAALVRATKPGARLHILCFTEDLPEGFPGSFGISEQNLRDTVGRSWTITGLSQVEYLTSMTPQQFAGIMRLMLPGAEAHDLAPGALGVDDDGHLKLPMWKLTAERA